MPVYDIEKITNRIDLLAQNTELRVKMSGENLIRIQEFDSKKVKNIIKNIYEEELV